MFSVTLSSEYACCQSDHQILNLFLPFPLFSPFERIASSGQSDLM